MEFLNNAVLVGALLLFVSIVASVVSSRLGAPLLLVFLALGMLAGEEGLGIRFANIELSYLVGSVALAVILLDGGLRTRTDSFRAGLRPAVSLATVGVIVTSGIVGLVAASVLDLHWLQGLLLGAVIGSTDAAAVFSVLHGQGMNLKRRVGATLEIESGSNDPMAVFLTITFVELLAAGRTELDWMVLGDFFRQFGIGGLVGVLGGFGLAALINRLTLATGLYPLMVTAGGLLVFAFTNFIGGSGFLAVYLVGVVLGNGKLRSYQHILRMHDGLAWLSQIGMFLILGLLVTPSDLLTFAPAAMLIAFVLIFVARPTAVWLSLLPFAMPWREQVYISWVGLRGAVPIVLALFPLLAGLDQSYTYFNVAFFVVLVSLLLQGWSVAPVARLLRLDVPGNREPVLRVDTVVPGHPDYEILVYHLTDDSPAVNRPPNQLPLPASAHITTVIRNGALLKPDGVERLRVDDFLHVLAASGDVTRLDRLFTAPAYREEHLYFGDFVLKGDALLGDVALTYGFRIPEGIGARTVAEHLSSVFHGVPVVGDSVHFEGVELVVREMEGDRITRVGLKLRK